MGFFVSDLVSQENLDMSNIVAVTLYVKDMSLYASMNEIYVSRLSKVNPPVRVCVQCPLNVHVILDATAYKKIDITDSDTKVHNRHTMHVQSVSHWAPANIGPYSQAIRVSLQKYFQFEIQIFMTIIVFDNYSLVYFVINL